MNNDYEDQQKETTEYTKPPWKWDRVDNKGTLQLMGNSYAPEMTPVLVADKCKNNDGKGCNPGGDRYCPLEPSKEDRALIKAAPNLLEALKFSNRVDEAWRKFVENNGKSKDIDELCEMVEEFEEKKERAIARAEGRKMAEEYCENAEETLHPPKLGELASAIKNYLSESCKYDLEWHWEHDEDDIKAIVASKDNFEHRVEWDEDYFTDSPMLTLIAWRQQMQVAYRNYLEDGVRNAIKGD